MKKKIFYLTRFFNGLHHSFLDGVWKPDGVPTIYKMIEGLDRSKFDVQFMFSNYNLNASPKFEKFYTEYNFKNLNSKFHILSVNSHSYIFRKIKNFIFIIKKFFFIINFVRQFKPDIVYIDRSHVIEGAILKCIFNCKVFVRVMGVTVYSYNDILSGKSLYSKLSRWSFKRNFTHILFSQDGGDIQNFKEKYLVKNVSSSIFFNGVKKKKGKVNYFQKINKKYHNKIKILFVSRLENNKNCDLFLQSIINLNENLKKRVIIFIVGVGSEYDKLKNFVKKTKSQHLIKFLGAVKHDVINDIYDISDIFVSLNTTGNLSNNCLEAFNSGVCCIIPEENKHNGCDKIINKYIRKDSIIRVSFENMENNLTKTITNLVNNKKKISFYSNNIRKDAEKFLISWDQRIQKELLLLNKLVNQK